MQCVASPCHVSNLVKSNIQKTPNFASLNAFSNLQNLPTSDDISTGGVRVETASARSEEDQRCFEFKCAREKEVAIGCMTSRTGIIVAS
jgi:hypothetical protein